jgi:hypothetical protein
LTFHAIVGRGELDLPVLKQVVGGASRQIMLIHVAGSLQHPETRREAFPVVNKALQNLQTDLNGQPRSKGRLQDGVSSAKKSLFGPGVQR